LALARAVDDSDMQEIELGQIDRPALIIVGDHDHFVSPKIPDRLADTIPGSRLVRLPGVGRLVPEETPDTVANMILDFVGAASMARTD
jgi:pimeloyl-ACP methyl ester carboxylesterase